MLGTDVVRHGCLCKCNVKGITVESYLGCDRSKQMILRDSRVFKYDSRVVHLTRMMMMITFKFILCVCMNFI